MYLRHRPPGRNKIQDAWSPKVHRVIDIQGTTHTVVPVTGGSLKRVHRSNLRLCVGPIPQPKPNSQSVPPFHGPEADPDSETECPDSEPDFLLMEQVEKPASPRLEDLECHLEDVNRSEMECEQLSDVSDLGDRPREDHSPRPEPVVGGQLERPIPPPRRRAEQPHVAPPTPAPRKSLRTTAGQNRNPFNLPMSACNAMSFYP